MKLRNLKLKIIHGGLAQLARASALHAEGQGFDSLILHQNKGPLSRGRGIRMKGKKIKAQNN